MNFFKSCYMENEYLEEISESPEDMHRKRSTMFKRPVLRKV